MFEFYRKIKFEKLQKKYDEEIRKKCEKHRIDLLDCLKRLKVNECKYNNNKFQNCIINFDKDFRFKYDVK